MQCRVAAQVLKLRSFLEFFETRLFFAKAGVTFIPFGGDYRLPVFIKIFQDCTGFEYTVNGIAFRQLLPLQVIDAEGCQKVPQARMPGISTGLGL